MYKFVKEAHSGIAYIVLIMLLVSTVFYFIKSNHASPLKKSDKTVSLVTMIFVHVQFLLGIVLYMVSPQVQSALKNFGAAMKESSTRLIVLEHPMIMIIVVILVTVANSIIRKAAVSNRHLKLIAPIIYLVAFILALSRIPWSLWLGK